MLRRCTVDYKSCTLAPGLSVSGPQVWKEQNSFILTLSLTRAAFTYRTDCATVRSCMSLFSMACSVAFLTVCPLLYSLCAGTCMNLCIQCTRCGRAASVRKQPEHKYTLRCDRSPGRDYHHSVPSLGQCNGQAAHNVPKPTCLTPRGYLR